MFYENKKLKNFFEQGLFGVSLNIKNDQDKQKPPIKKQTCIETFKSYPLTPTIILMSFQQLVKNWPLEDTLFCTAQEWALLEDLV